MSNGKVRLAFPPLPHAYAGGDDVDVLPPHATTPWK